MTLRAAVRSDGTFPVPDVQPTARSGLGGH